MLAGQGCPSAQEPPSPHYWQDGTVASAQSGSRTPHPQSQPSFEPWQPNLQVHSLGAQLASTPLRSRSMPSLRTSGAPG